MTRRRPPLPARGRVRILAFVALCAIPALARAQFSIDWRTIEPGTRLTVGTFELTFVVAQPDAGATFAAAPFTLAGGYLAGDGPGCPADLDNGSGTGIPDNGVDINDLLFFLSKFEAGNAAADLDNGTGTGTPDGGVDINDLLFFLTHFESGC
jgi:hypothetical protein